MENNKEASICESTFYSETKIVKYIMDTGIMSKNTVYKWLKTFKRCLYYCSSNLSNPMFLHIAEEELQVSPELIYIHALMYKFVCKEHAYIKFSPLICIEQKNEICKFTWKVPDNFMPCLAAYIAATSTMKKSSTTSFFKKWQESFDDIIFYLRNTSEKEHLKSNYDLENISNSSYNWMNTNLAKRYFDILENIYTSYSKCDEQKAVIRNAILGLTFMIIDCKQTHLIIPYAIKLLSTYKKRLDEKISSGKINKRSLVKYYPNDETMMPVNMLKIVQNYSKNIFICIDNFLNFIVDQLHTYHTDTKYGISVKNYDIFEEQCYEYLHQHIVPQINSVHDTLYSFTLKLKDDLANTNNMEYANHVFQTSNAEKYVDMYTDIINKYYRNIEEAIKNFFGYVKMASSKNPEKNSKLKVNIDYFHLFKMDLKEYQKQLEQKVVDTFKNLPPLINYPVSGYTKEFAYPVFTFYEKDILRIIKELSLFSADILDEKIIRCLHNNFEFPMKSRDVTELLLKRDEIFSSM